MIAESMQKPAQLTVEVHGLPVAYRRSGEGEALVYFHGAPLSGQWLPLHDELATRFDVIVPDHPGFGNTPRPEWLTDFNDLVIHYAEFLDSLSLGKVHLVGHGLGGWIAAEFASFYPERLSALTLIAPAGLRPCHDERPPDIFRLEDDIKLFALLGEDMGRWRSSFEDSDPLEQKVKDYHESIAEALISWNPRYNVKLERRLNRVTAPSLILLPQNERYLAPSIGKRFGEVLPSAVVQIVKGGVGPTEHLLVLQEPHQIADAIRGGSHG